MIFKTGALVWRAFGRFQNHAGPDRAAAVAYYTLLSLIPLLIFLISIGVAVMGSFDAAWSGTLYLFGGVVVHFDDAQRDALRAFVERTQRLQWPGIILLAWTSKRIFGALFGALESIFGVQGGFFRGHLVAFSMVLLTGVALFVTLALTTVIAAVDGFIARALGPHAPHLVHDFTAFLLTSGLPAVIAFTFFFIIYRMMPRRHVSNRNAAAGAALATLLWELAKAGFSYYVRNLAHYAGLYGALEAILVLALWLEVSASVILFCAEVVALLVAIPQPQTAPAALTSADTAT